MSAMMFRNSLLPCVLAVLLVRGKAEDILAVSSTTEETATETAILTTPELTEIPPTTNIVEDAIKVFEQRANLAEKTENQGVLAEEEIEKLYEDMVAPLERIIELMQESTNVYKFVEAKGIDRVILPHLRIFHTDLRMQLLILTKLLFDVAPTTTTVMIPAGVLDKLLEIFEDDDNLALKARTVDILFAWLPENPKVQARVMRLKGLEPFYDQVHKLDAGVIHTLLKLFNKILKEHLKARNEYHQKNKSDMANLNIYKKIGLIERVSSGKVCHGLMNIFQSMWTYSVHNNKDLMLPVFEIMINVEPYCVDFYKGKAKVLEFFQNLLKHLAEGGQAMTDDYERLGLNSTRLVEALNKYVERLTLSNRDEL